MARRKAYVEEWREIARRHIPGGLMISPSTSRHTRSYFALLYEVRERHVSTGDYRERLIWGPAHYPQSPDAAPEVYRSHRMFAVAAQAAEDLTLAALAAEGGKWGGVVSAAEAPQSSREGC